MFEDFSLTNKHGDSPILRLYVPDAGTTTQPYLYNLCVRAPNNTSMTYQNIPVFAQETTMVIMPFTQASTGSSVYDTNYVIPSIVQIPDTNHHSDSFIYTASRFINPTWPDEVIKAMLYGLKSRMNPLNAASSLTEACTPPLFYFQRIADMADELRHTLLCLPDQSILMPKRETSFTELIKLAEKGYDAQALWAYMLKQPVQLCSTADHHMEQKSPPTLLSKTPQSDSNQMPPHVIKLIQRQLQKVSSYYPTVPFVVDDGNFKKEDKVALIAFQRLLGIYADGNLHGQVLHLLQQITAELP